MKKLIKKLKGIIKAINHYFDLIDRIRDVEKIVRLQQRQLTSLQAIDYGWHESGKIIILAHVGEQDIIKIIDIKPRYTMTEYTKIVRHVAAVYGASPDFIDSPRPKREWRDVFIPFH